MLKKNLSVIFVIVIFLLTAIFFMPHDRFSIVNEVISPVEFLINGKHFKIDEIDTFDSLYTNHNTELARKLGITDKEAFLLGNLAKSWAYNLMNGREVLIRKPNDLVYSRNSYKEKFKFSGYCLINSTPFDEGLFKKRLQEVRRGNFVVLDLDELRVYNVEDLKIKSLSNFLVMRKRHLPKEFLEQNIGSKPNFEIKTSGIKVLFTDSTSKIIPDRNCETLVCQEILTNINNAMSSIDIAIYGYSSVPKLETALKNAIARGVKIRLVFDNDSKGNNIYPDTDKILSIIPNNKSDFKSQEVNAIMHNKFYIFDEKILITGSANMSHTDMSGFNSNSIIVFNSPVLSEIYKQEFNQMYDGNFHNSKKKRLDNTVNVNGTKVLVYFSPQDKAITNAVLPLIKSAKKYIYIPTFVLTEKRVTEELINAKKRGVDVKIIIDALNASIRHSKHQELRLGGLQVKTENYAGKMHSKSMIVDDKYTVIGSMNFSNSGENKNDENLIVIENSTIAKGYKDFFIYQWDRIDDKWLKSNVRAESLDSIGSCFDGLDNNYDGKIDTKDEACKI